MTVGKELAEATSMKLFHNHMTIELIAPLFGYGSKSPIGTKLVDTFRTMIFEEFAASNQEGLIFTYIRAVNLPQDTQYIHDLANIFTQHYAEVYRVELEADVDERLVRNHHPDRLAAKPTKKNLKKSEKDLKDSMQKYRLNSLA